jgi:hypothetical protein
MVSSRHSQDYQEDAAIAAAIAAVEAANAAAAATTMIDSHAGNLFGGGGGGESNSEDIESAIVDFAESIDIDEEGVNVGVGTGGNISDGNNRGNISDSDDKGDDAGGGWGGEGDQEIQER